MHIYKGKNVSCTSTVQGTVENPINLYQRRTSLIPYWISSFSSNLCALSPVLSHAGSAPSSLQSVKEHCLSPKYIIDFFSSLWLPGLTFKAITLFIHTEIKSCRTENSICLIEGLQEFHDLTYLDTCKNKGLSHFLQGLPGSKKSATTSHTLPFYYKRSLNSNSGKIVLLDTNEPFSWSADFLNKVTIPCSNTLSIYLACHVLSSMTLLCVCAC